jgi:hypothetical protein
MSRPAWVLLALTLWAVFSFANASSSDAILVSSPGVHNWLFDTSGSGGVDTKAEAVTVAKRHDVVIGAARYKQFLPAMKAAKPGIVVAQYHKGIAVDGSKLDWVKANHPSWLLRSSSGGLLRSSWGTYLLDPGNSGVRSWQAAYARDAQAAGWSGVYLDSLGLYGLTAFGPWPVNPRTGAAYTTSAWIRDEAGLAAVVNNAISVPLLINGMRSGPDYWSTTSPLVSSIQAGEFEGCFRGATSRITAWPTASVWLATVRALQDVQSKGRDALCWTKTWTSATSSQIAAWHDYALASVLLANQGRAQFFFSGRRSDNGNSWYGDDQLAIGSPTGSLTHTAAGVYYRAYSGGMVVVNPTGASAPLSLGANYLTEVGQVVSKITVAAHSGVVLSS